MEKVKLPREVAEAIEELRNAEWSNRQILQCIGVSVMAPVLILCGFVELHDFDTLLQALINGYEVEQTPEDKVREEYQSHAATQDYGNAYRQAVRDTLNTLNIKVEGVNSF